MSRPSRTAYQFTLTAMASAELDALVMDGFARNRSLAVERLILDESNPTPGWRSTSEPGPKRSSWLSDPWETHFARIREQHGRRSVSGHTILVDGPGSYSEEKLSCRLAFGKDDRPFECMLLEDRRLVAGTGGGSNGSFGNMRPAVAFREAVDDERRARLIGALLLQLPLSTRAPVELASLRDVLTALVAIDGVGLGAATRLLAVRRPDQFLPVNAGNVERVGTMLRRVRLDSSAHRVDDYVNLIAAIRGAPWFNAPVPRPGTAGQWIWYARVAMLDAALLAERV